MTWPARETIRSKITSELRSSPGISMRVLITTFYEVGQCSVRCIKDIGLETHFVMGHVDQGSKLTTGWFSQQPHCCLTSLTPNYHFWSCRCWSRFSGFNEIKVLLLRAGRCISWPGAETPVVAIDLTSLSAEFRLNSKKYEHLTRQQRISSTQSCPNCNILSALVLYCWMLCCWLTRLNTASLNSLQFRFEMNGTLAQAVKPVTQF